MSLKKKTISGLFWSFFDNFFYLLIQFVIGIILAKILSPKEFGLIGLITVFLAISQTFIDSGFSNSLIRKLECTDVDYSTIFYFNIITSLLFYFILYFSSNIISDYFKEPILSSIIKTIGLGIIIKSLSSVHTTILISKIDFKLQTKISIVSSLISGIVGIILAYKGFGVWSLVIKLLVGNSISTILLWLTTKWTPKFIFSLQLLSEHFNFGYKLLFSSLTSTLYENIYYLIIGKYFNASQLGYYTRAEQFSNIASTNLTAVVQKVSYPVFSKLQNEPVMLKNGYKRLIKSTMFISFIVMLGIVGISNSLILFLLGTKWEQSIIYLKLICISSMFYPLHALNLNILIFRNRTDLYLKIEIIKKIISIPVIILAIYYGINAMLIGFVFLTIIGFYLNSYWSIKLIGYSAGEQILDIMPSFILALVVGVVIYFIDFFTEFSSLLTLFIQSVIGFFLIIIFSTYFKIEGYFEIKNLLTEFINKKKIATL